MQRELDQFDFSAATAQYFLAEYGWVEGGRTMEQASHVTSIVRYGNGHQTEAEAMASELGGVAVCTGEVPSANERDYTGLVFLRCSAMDIWASRFSDDHCIVPFAVVGMSRPIEKMRYGFGVALLGEEWRWIDEQMEPRARIEMAKRLLGTVPPPLERPTLRVMVPAALAIALMAAATMPVAPPMMAVSLDVGVWAATHLFLTRLRSGRHPRSPLDQVSVPIWIRLLGTVIETLVGLLLLGHAVLRWNL